MPSLKVYLTPWDEVHEDGFQLRAGREVTPDDARLEVVDCTPDSFDVSEGLTPSDLAFKWISENAPSLEPSQSPLPVESEHLWLSGSCETYRPDGWYEDWSVHFDGFSGLEVVEIVRRVIG